MAEPPDVQRAWDQLVQQVIAAKEARAAAVRAVIAAEQVAAKARRYDEYGRLVWTDPALDTAEVQAREAVVAAVAHLTESQAAMKAGVV